MRWVGGAAAGIVVVACSATNPGFYVDTASSPETTETTTSGSSDGSTRADDDTSSGTDDVDTTADPGDSETRGSSTTDPLDTTGTSTGEPASSTGEDSSTEDGTTGEVETEEYVNLHAACDDPPTMWNSQNGNIMALPCQTVGPPPEPPKPWAGYLFDFMFDGEVELDVVAMTPAAKKGAVLTGDYNALLLPPTAVTPHLRATLECQASPKICDIVAGVRLEDELSNATIINIPEIALTSGQQEEVDIDLSDYVADLTDKKFRVVLFVIANSGTGGDRGVWVHPRIVEVN